MHKLPDDFSPFDKEREKWIEKIVNTIPLMAVIMFQYLEAEVYYLRQTEKELSMYIEKLLNKIDNLDNKR